MSIQFSAFRLRRWSLTSQSIQFLLFWSLLVTTGIVMVFHLATLTTLPVVFIDEPWHTSVSWNWLQTGEIFDSIHSGPLDQFGYSWMRRPFLSQIPWVISFAIGGLGFFQARVVSWFFGIILLLATFGTCSRLYNRMTGALSVLLLSLSQPFLQSSHYSRQDMMLIAIVMSGFALVIVALQDNKLWLHFLAGLLFGFTADIHWNGLMFIPGIAALYFLAYGRKMFLQRGTWLIMAGGVIGIAYYIISHILPNPEIYQRLFSLDTLLAQVNRVPISDLSLQSFLVGVRNEIGRYHFYDNSLDFALIGASIVYLLVRRSAADRQLLTLVTVTFLCFTIFVFHKDNLYAIMLYPIFLIMVSEVLRDVASNGINSPKLPVVLSSALFMFMIINSVEHIRRPWGENRDYDYYHITNQIEAVLPEGVRVMGMPHWWFGLAEYDFRSNLNIIFYNFYNGYDLVEGLEAIHPDYIIVDRWQREWLIDANEITPGYPGIPRSQFTSFLDDHGEQILEFENEWHGPITVYRINWE